MAICFGVKLKLKENKLILPVTLHGEDSRYTGEALIDTGSAFMVIPPAVDEMLNLKQDPVEPLVKLSTASGVITVEKKILPRIDIGKLSFKNISVVVHELPEPVPVKILIGMNLLLKMKLILNGKEKNFELEDPNR